MNFQKLDARLAIALTEMADPDKQALPVFISTLHAPKPDEATILKAFGVPGVTAERQIFTATLSAHAVANLSEQPWVQSLQLSRKLQLMEGVS